MSTPHRPASCEAAASMAAVRAVSDREKTRFGHDARVEVLNNKEELEAKNSGRAAAISQCARTRAALAMASHEAWCLLIRETLPYSSCYIQGLGFMNNPKDSLHGMVPTTPGIPSARASALVVARRVVI